MRFCSFFFFFFCLNRPIGYYKSSYVVGWLFSKLEKISFELTRYDQGREITSDFAGFCENWGNINIELNILRLICASYWLSSYVFVVDLNFRKRLLAILFFFLLFLLHWYTVMLDLNWKRSIYYPFKCIIWNFH